MITEIDIEKFGLFSDYQWKQNIKDDIFKKVNIIYGRNYSGKTTLSRILKCVGDRKLHEQYTDGAFKITNIDKSTSTNTNLVSPYNIRVYNTDFVRENLMFLYDESRDIKPFTLLGSENQGIQIRIDEITGELGSIESKKGLLFDQNKQSELLRTANTATEKKDGALTGKLRTKANDEIKKNPNFVKQGTTYTISNIQQEIGEIIKSPTAELVLTDAEKDIHKATINEQSKPDITKIGETKPTFAEKVISTRKLVEKSISVTNTIQELVNDAVLQTWVNKGRELHKNQRDKCAFCGSDITSSRWEEIDAHFSKELEELKAEIKTETGQLNELKLKLQTFLEDKDIKKDSFYTAFHSKYDTVNAQWGLVTTKYADNINMLISALSKRDADIFTALTVEDIEDNSEEILSTIIQFNELIETHNSKTNQLETDKDSSRTILRFSEIKSFIDSIDYNALKKDIEDSKAKNKADKEVLDQLSGHITALELEKTEKEHAQKDEGAAALKVNELLSRFFGHNGLMLDPEANSEDGTPKTRFIIKRGTEKAHNLSEGECSLIAFCYFIAKMDDELKGADSDKLLIYIDDPISSLDNNHIFFMFSLIESIICKEKKYGQLFISTHNLEFLKYSKTLTSANKQINHFIIQREKSCFNERSVIKKMPPHLRDNITEYSFLFEELYNVISPLSSAEDVRIEANYTHFYNLANNMRKFLECYLWYRLPNNKTPLNNLDILFDHNIPTLVNRVIHEGSHLAWGDRGTLPQDVVEAKFVATEILKAIKSKDSSHFDSLCESVGVDKSIAF